MAGKDFSRMLADPSLIYGPALHGLLSSLRVSPPGPGPACTDCGAPRTVAIPLSSTLLPEGMVLGTVHACSGCEPDPYEAFRNLFKD